MALAVGSRLGPYEITAALGGGGMGEVYRARDPKLGRDVAIKVLPGEVAKHEERLARFKREAQLLAALNHPNIAAIYGLDEAEGQMFLVLELVDGEDLAERLKRGAIPVDESIAIARQIGEALEEAHEKGIVHRDLKPANIKLTLDGKVKVLDFGLAKAYASEGSSGGSPEISHSPTMTHRGTEPGMILGSAAYMSPEQARGKAVDKRADIWSFGVVLYEMLTGQRLFAGETVSDVLASVLKQDIDWSRVPVGAPRELRRLLAGCLDRDPRNRLHDIADARIALEEARHGEPGSMAAAPEGRPRPRWLIALPWSVAGLALLMAAAFGLRGGGERPSGSRPLTVFGVLMPEQHFLPLSEVPILDLSGDGRTLLFVGEGQRPPTIFRRPLASMSVSRVEGTEDAEHPALSRDGRWIAFFARGALRKVPVEGGSPIVVAEAPAPRGLSWTPDGGLVFSPRYNSPLFRVAAAGGPPVEVTTLDTAKGERTHRWPQVLPDGRTVMFTVGLASSPGDYDGSRIEAQSLDTGERRTVVRGARMARYTAAGYLVYQRGSTLLAVRFDARRGEATGEPFTIHEGVGGDASSGAGYFTVSDAGAVALAPETSIPKDRALVLVDAAGRETALNLPPAPFNHPRFSPDGRRITLAIGTGSAGTDDVYIVDLASQRMQRLTFDQGHGAPLWSPDGRRILYTNGRSGEIGLQTRAADGSGDAVTIVRGSELLLPDAWLPDGRRVAATAASGSIDIQIVDTQAGGQLTPLFANPSFGESAAAVSPDGRYVAYASTETGTDEIIVETLPPGRGKWQISVAGGVNPAWSRGGRSLYFASVDGLMAVDVDTREGFHPGTPRVLFTGPYELRTLIQRNYDVGPDGRFVVVKRQVTSRTPQPLLMLDGWEVADPARTGGR